jgi:hypothetical protein
VAQLLSGSSRNWKQHSAPPSRSRMRRLPEASNNWPRPSSSGSGRCSDSQAPVWLILREMEGVRQEAQAGAGDPADLLEHIYEAARGVEGMMDVHQVIADYVGPQVRVDLHVAVTNTSKPRLSPGISAKGSPISRTACAATPPAGGKAATSASRAWRGQNRPEQVRDSGFWLEDRSPELVRGGSQ